MRRTYKSKKDYCGAFDPKEVLINSDKSSAFDALYINNIKQAKRELSTLSNTCDHLHATKKRIRTKYAKHNILQDVLESLCETVQTKAAYLTPNKSMRVNKTPDLFDQILNSTKSPEGNLKQSSDEYGTVQEKDILTPLRSNASKGAIRKFNYSSEDYDSCQEVKENVLYDDEHKKKLDVSEQYIISTPYKHPTKGRKNLPIVKRKLKKSNNKIKKYAKINISNESTNSSANLSKTKETDVTDLLNFDLITEQEHKNTYNHDDDDIEKLLNIKSAIDKVYTSNEKVVHTPRNVYNRLTAHCPDPGLHSPLTSTPYLQKYRGQSIYKLSPINTINGKENEIMPSPRLQNKNKSELFKLLVIDDVAKTKVDIENVAELSNDQEAINKQVTEAQSENISEKPNKNNLQKQYSMNSVLEVSSYEPFFGFTLNKDDSNTSDSCNSVSENNSVTKNNYNNSSIEVIPDEHELSECTAINTSIASNNNKCLIVGELSCQKDAIQLNNDMSLDYKIFHDLSENEEFPEDKNKDQESKSDLQPNISCKNDSNDLFDSVSESINVDCYEKETTNAQSQHLSDELFYDANTSTMSQNTILKTFGDKNKPVVKLEQLNNSYLNDSIEDLNEEYALNNSRDVIRTSSDNSLMNFKDSNTDKTDIDDDGDNDDFDTPNDAARHSDENYEEESDDENRSISFVTTRRRNYNKDSTMFIMNDSTTSTNECDETVINAISESPILKSKVVCKAQNNSDFIDDFDLKNTDDKDLCNSEIIQRPSIVLQPGKKWERSLSIYKRMTSMKDNFDISLLEEEPLSNKGRHYRQSVINTMELQEHNGSIYNESHLHRRSTIVPKSYKPTVKIIKETSTSRFSISSTKYDDTSGFLNEECNDTLVELSKLSLAEAEPDITVIEARDERFVSASATARDYVLRRCNQSEAILFDECYPESVLKNCRKIGEGVYGEVFLCRGGDGRARVMKIVPVAGNIRVNGEHQKDFQEIISEIVIAMELSALRSPIAEFERYFDEGKDLATLDLHSIDNATDAFNEVLAVKCVYGNYPSRLLDLWDLYDECKGSDNDNPAVLPNDQQYIVLELANAGQDLESYQFNSAEQAYALLIQIAFGLAVGEEAFQFEHRDLHWGNVLIAPTDQKFGTYLLRGQTHRVPRCGVSATIIDYSLSRLSLPLAAEEHAALFNDLSTDEGLFNAVGDYQFDVYRLMRERLGNDWKNFEPYTNVLWLHYTVDKMITQLRYRRTNTKIHRQYIAKLKGFKSRILNYGSATQFVLTDNEY